ncbi:hypothetical protein BATDEDRAFT_90113 [Batrachochytrium dendrobatidis JAM81]|uniref:Coiled-coil domain-containing protein 12 n=2 Tax=Batrachochytrium dendrobatidis TaxID=109871 RepID=F4P6Z5_BATDJ|nr:uncharacterized protein BATDEDRAFT_90113 [Batrachochytrium dendrobatidis JAM81]EGF78932.1 hypothetical protein BATDEDRAFT_90113 [Batrachochytrium dendrobatidis JAM81]KAK5667287.1 hypothetical protein QVD99_005901 [Batrachochytrium dendrobatidis]OAJ42122.1 hypothetical protein BDEG_25623 [Batrachochytrium dendrobatidis JEL423]|eukprot:XP_006680507.1 hypothetical protein BATDEDRAFT_90113 [Batrachochytrium dendrobatidis JAM81]
MGLSEAAENRKERLAALRKQVQQGASTTSNTNGVDTKRHRQESDTESAVETSASALRFRNYQPETDALKDYVETAPIVGPHAKHHVDTVEGQAETIKHDALEAEEARNKELDLTNLAPKKPNWDLKRDLNKKLEKLDRKTKKAAANLVRQRLKASKDISMAADATEASIHAADEGDSDE